MNPAPPTGQPPTSDIVTAQWFDSIGTQPPLPSRPSSKKRFLLIACFVLLLAAGSGIASFFLTKQPNCLSAADYMRLTGTTTTDTLTPTEGFYADYVAFRTNSNDFDNSGEHGESLIQKIASFYSTLDKETSIIITIKGNFFDKSVAGRTQERLNAVQSSLISSGVPKNVLKMTTPVYIEPEEAGTETSEILISITSVSSCK